MSIDALVPYRVQVDAAICDTTINLYNDTAIIQTGKRASISSKVLHHSVLYFHAVRAISIPVVTNMVRTSATAMHLDIAQSVRHTTFEVSYYAETRIPFEEVKQYQNNYLCGDCFVINRIVQPEVFKQDHQMLP